MTRSTIKILIDAGADMNVRDKDGLTPLCHAVISQDVSFLKYLIEARADANIKDICGCSPLFHAVESQNMCLVKILFEVGADINATDCIDKKSVIFIAIKLNNLRILRFLIDSGANVNFIDCNNNTPLFDAVKYRNSSIVEMLLNAGTENDAVSRNPYSVNYQNIPLNLAVLVGKVNMVKLLVDSGANVNLKSISGLTPVHCAVNSSNKLILEFISSCIC